MPARASTSISPLTSELSSISVSSRIPSTAAVPRIFGRAWPAFQFLREITDGFSEERKLGQGAFGIVYRGVTRNGDDVAVKLLPKSSQDYGPLRNEFYNLRKLNHQNIVQVLGYCFETEKKPIMQGGIKVFVDEIRGALCLEYMHNGSLQQHLSDELSGLEWHPRFKIIKGTCEGLNCIHEELKEPIYHLDLKPDNILLDKDMVQDC